LQTSIMRKIKLAHDPEKLQTSIMRKIKESQAQFGSI